MRDNPTKHENILWKKLKKKALGFTFHRQKLIKGYIVDFWCPAKALAVEVDGDSHLTNKTYDKRRDAHLSAIGVKVIRFTNSQVENETDSVIREILLTLSAMA